MIFFKPEESGVTDNPDRPLTAALIKAYDGETQIGSCRVLVDEYKCSISDINAGSGDELLVEGLIRSALSYAANRNAYIAHCNCASYEKVLRELGFESDDGEFTGEIPELLKGKCCK